jgi:hypothetical protein
MLLAPSDWSLAQSSDDVLSRLSVELSPHTSPETTPGSWSSLLASTAMWTRPSQSSLRCETR